jgi:hypothetical protein
MRQDMSVTTMVTYEYVVRPTCRRNTYRVSLLSIPGVGCSGDRPKSKKLKQFSLKFSDKTALNEEVLRTLIDSIHTLDLSYIF